MLTTYEVYLTDRDGRCWFEPLLAESPTHLMTNLRQRLVRQRLQGARVERQGRVLFKLEY